MEYSIKDFSMVNKGKCHLRHNKVKKDKVVGVLRMGDLRNAYKFLGWKQRE